MQLLVNENLMVLLIFLIQIATVLCSESTPAYRTNEKPKILDQHSANELILTSCDPNLNFQVTSLAKPDWPRSTPTIPSMFFKSANENVCFICLRNFYAVSFIETITPILLVTFSI